MRAFRLFWLQEVENGATRFKPEVVWKAALKWVLNNSECVGPTKPDGIPGDCDTIKLIEKELGED